MGDALDPEIIKRTQDVLGQIISAPALTEKLLSRPPVQFLQDIVKAVVKKTGFLQGLYSDDELTPAYLKEGRDNKTLFMKKLVTAVYIAVKRPPEVRVSKILSGQEADKTNLLLQALAEAINADVDNNEVIRKTLQNVGDNNENEEPAQGRDQKDQKDQERSERHRSKEERSSKSREREREEPPPPEKKSSSRDASRDQGDNAESSHSKRRRSSRVNDDSGNDERKPATVPRQDDDDDNEKKDETDSRSRRPARPSSAKGPRKQQNSESQRPTSPKRSPEPPARQPHTAAPTERDTTDERPLVRPGTANTAAKSRKPMKPTTSDEISAPSGRAPSAAQRGQGTLIIESKDSRDGGMNNDDDDDEDDNFLAQEEKPSQTKSFKQDDSEGRGGDQDDDEGDQHGALVSKMIDSKKKLEHGSEIAGQRADVKTIAQNDAQRRREREKIQKDVDKLRETIQTLTKSVVPLGKILEYLQEDYEMMAKEMQQYTDEYKRTVVELRKEKFTTDQSLEPLRAALLDFDDQIADMKNRIVYMKKKINTNEKANATRLLDIIRKTK